MKCYKYTAMDAQGKEKSGNIDAENENDANAKLKEIGLFPTSISKIKTPKQPSEEDKKSTIEQIFDNSLIREPEKIKIKLFGLITVLTIEKN